MTSPTPQRTNDLRAAMMTIHETYEPIFDAADGIKAEMERRGWSPTAAEHIALTWLIGTIAASTGMRP